MSAFDGIVKEGNSGESKNSPRFSPLSQSSQLSPLRPASVHSDRPFSLDSSVQHYQQMSNLNPLRPLSDISRLSPLQLAVPLVPMNSNVIYTNGDSSGSEGRAPGPSNYPYLWATYSKSRVLAGEESSTSMENVSGNATSSDGNGIRRSMHLLDASGAAIHRGSEEGGSSREDDRSMYSQEEPANAKNAPAFESSVEAASSQAHAPATAVVGAPGPSTLSSHDTTIVTEQDNSKENHHPHISVITTWSEESSSHHGFSKQGHEEEEDWMSQDPSSPNLQRTFSGGGSSDRKSQVRSFQTFGDPNHRSYQTFGDPNHHHSFQTRSSAVSKWAGPTSRFSTSQQDPTSPVKDNDV
jgi:hypothetical protein